MSSPGHRTAIGATALALLLTAGGTTFATVRAARQQQGDDVALEARAPNAPADLAPSAGPGPSGVGGPLATASASVPGGAPQHFGPPTGAAAGLPSDASVRATTPGAAAGGPPGVLAEPSGSGPPAAEQAPLPGDTGASPPQPAGAAPPARACPTDAGRGALAAATGALQAPDLVLPWPGLAPLVLSPQMGAPRQAGASVVISSSSSGALVSDGAGLSLPAPRDVDYTLTAGSDTAQGTIRFTPVDLPVSVVRQACSNRSFVLHDVDRGSVDGSPLRIVGAVSEAGDLTLDETGGLARFRSSRPGLHQVALVTASDAGVADSLIFVTIVVS